MLRYKCYVTKCYVTNGMLQNVMLQMLCYKSYVTNGMWQIIKWYVTNGPIGLFSVLVTLSQRVTHKCVVEDFKLC